MKSNKPNIIGSCEVAFSRKVSLEETLRNGDGAASVPSPDGIKPFQRASPEEQLRRAHVVLKAARKLYRESFGPMWQCLQEAGQARLECEFARRLLRSMLLDYDLLAWERHPTTKRADVYRLLDAAIRRSAMRHGGWIVSVTP